MKKKLIIAIGVIIGASILGFGLIHSSSTQLEPSLSAYEIKTLVSDQYPGEIAEPKLMTEANRPVYEVNSSSSEWIYEIKLDGHSGEVLNIIKKPNENSTIAKNEQQEADQKKKAEQEKKEKQKKRDKEKQQEQKKEKKQEKAKKEKQVSKTVISPEEAGRIALTQFSGTIDEIELDEEDGRLIYEVEIERGDQEAEIEIDAYTGEVIVIEIDED